MNLKLIIYKFVINLITTNQIQSICIGKSKLDLVPYHMYDI